MEMVLRKGEVGDVSANGLLAALPGASRERLIAKTQLVSLSVKDILYHPGDSITAVYFPLDVCHFHDDGDEEWSDHRNCHRGE